jgi:ferric iron reductase FhuF-like transporter
MYPEERARMSAERLDYQDVISQLPPALQAWLTFECLHLHKPAQFQNTSRDPGFDPKYFPQNCGAFQLPCYWIQGRHLYICGRQDCSTEEINFFSGLDRHERVLFPIHPSALPDYRQFLSDVHAEDAAEQGLRIWAVPTSSTRTLLAWPDQQPHKSVFVKTSLYSPIFGDRRVRRYKLGRSVGLSRLMHEWQPALPRELGLLPESTGFVPRRTADSGAIVRSLPREVKDGRVLLAPVFALFGGTEHEPPLLLTLIQRNGTDPVKFVEELLCAPFAKLWLELSLRHGILLEAHAQDLLLALSPQLSPLNRFYYRDFEGLQVDWELRHRCGLGPAPALPHDFSWRETYSTWGYRYAELIWYKLHTSLFAYMHFVLNEAELSLREWRSRGLIDCAELADGEITMLFSRQMGRAVEALFGVRADINYNIYRAPRQFVRLLLKLRRELMGERPRVLP